MSATRPPASRVLAVLAALITVLCLVAPPPSSASASTGTHPTSAVQAAPLRPAADLSQFQPGNIISNAVFTNSATMTATQIQAFFESMVPVCQSGYTCLKDYRITSISRPADQYCNGYSGVPNELASSIIARVAQSCGINPQVLIVMLQKEQGLVTHVWPSQWRYDAALGQGCPDDAPCDPNFVGFFYQIYGAARQMKIYMEGRYFTWYAPGQTWNILYNPNRSCGSSPVYIQNSATAALYYYTPYQPNAAALAAGYGYGDSCSSYGNRNFYNYFTDWFGSTQGAAASLVAPVSGNAVYLVMGGTKYHVLSALDLAAFQSRLGSFQWVSQASVDALPSGGDISRYVYDPRTGTLYLLEPDGTKHRLPSVAAVASFGYTFGSYVSISGALADTFSTGPDVSDIFTPYQSGAVYQLFGSAKRHIWDSPALSYAVAGRSTYIATMEPAAAAQLTTGATLFAPNSLVRAASDSRVYLTTPTATIVHIPSFGLAADFGATRYTVVSDDALAASVRASTDLSPFVSCAGAILVLDGATLRTVTGTDTGGVTPTALAQGECAALPPLSSAPALSPPLFVQDPTGAVYVIDHGAARHILQYSDLVSLNGARPLQIASWSAAAVAAVGTTSWDLPENAFVSFTGRPQVYRFSGDALHLVRAFSTLLALGGGGVPPITVLPASDLSGFAIGAPLLTDSTDFVQFAGSPQVYQYQGGALHHILSYTTLLNLGNGALPPILRLDATLQTAYTIGQPIP